jgi:Squalene-hopene cyclase C-terminal domain/Prenyltransferase and squalene oxidase repeat
MQSRYSRNLQKAFDFVVAAQNGDGGWGYKRGGMSYVEPTCFALLALFSPECAGGQNVSTERFSAVERGLTWLRSQQHSDGGWGVMREDADSGWMTYPVVWLFQIMLRSPDLTNYFGKPEDRSILDRAKNWLLAKGREPKVTREANVQVKRLFRIESDYLGWAWGPNQAGWVIPTSLAMVALIVEDPKAMQQSDDILNAKDYLRDRACPVGGWNVGNPWMLGKQLPPTIDATAFALVAWNISLNSADFGANAEAIQGGLTYLETNLLRSNSDHALALGTWALGLFKTLDDMDSYRERMILGLQQDRTFKYKDQEFKLKPQVGQNKETGGWANSPYTTAIAALALSDTKYYFGL